MASNRLGKYITVTEEPQHGKTKVWTYWNKRTGEIAGRVKWSGAWRKYVFEVERESYYDWDFLRMVADFCETKTKEHFGKIL